MKETSPAHGTNANASRDSAPRAGSWPGFLSALRMRYRWVICALLFFGVTKNYMDRQVLGVLKNTLQQTFAWNEIDYGNLVFAFQTSYAVGMILIGRLIDRLGTRIGYAVAMIFWSFASMGHAIANSLAGFVVARFALGLGESGVFPASIKCVAEWFPEKERALATGIFNAGTNVGAIITPFLVPWIAIQFGWRWAFMVTGALGFLWLALWLTMYRKPEQHSRYVNSELELIPTETGGRISWLPLLSHRQTWAFATGKFLTDPIWWFYLFWIPDYLQRRHGLRLNQIGPPILAIYLISDFGSVAGGWLSSRLLKQGLSVNAARKWAMLVCGLCVLPIAAVYRIPGLWPAAILIGLAAAGHQGFSANLYTLSSDLFPSRAVASIVGIGGMAGAVGGMLIAQIVGHVLQWTNSYMLPFFLAASAYLLALLLIHLLSPKLAPARVAAE
jgi:ACS family hexuronate transporter-like MFS transporter